MQKQASSNPSLNPPVPSCKETVTVHRQSYVAKAFPDTATHIHTPYIRAAAGRDNCLAPYDRRCAVLTFWWDSSDGIGWGSKHT